MITRDKYKCHECSIGNCYSEYGNEEYNYCQNIPYWRALTEAIGRNR